MMVGGVGVGSQHEYYQSAPDSKVGTPGMLSPPQLTPPPKPPSPVTPVASGLMRLVSTPVLLWVLIHTYMLLSVHCGRLCCVAVEHAALQPIHVRDPRSLVFLSARSSM